MKTVKIKNKEQVKTILRKVFFLSPVKTIGIAIPSYIWVAYHLLKEEKDPILEYLSYFLSAYALVITVTGILRIVKWVRTGMKQNRAVQKVLEKPTVDRLLHEKTFRTRVALYTFYSVITAVINVVKYRKYGSPVLSAAKIISLTTALVAMFSLESAMLAQFAAEDQMKFRTIMTGCTGAVICLLIIGMALYMLITSTRKLHRYKKG